MSLEWNKIADKQPEHKQSVLAFNLYGNLVIIEYWRHDLKERVTHWMDKPEVMITDTEQSNKPIYTINN